MVKAVFNSSTSIQMKEFITKSIQMMKKIFNTGPWLNEIT